MPTIRTAKAPTTFPMKEIRSNGIATAKHGAVKAKKASPAPTVSTTLAENIGVRFSSPLSPMAIEPFLPLAFLMSGGASLRSFAPRWAFGACRWMEDRLERWRDTWAMFAQIVLERIPSPKV